MIGMTDSEFPSLPILIVDDEETAIVGYEFMLEAGGFTNTRRCLDSRKVMDLLADEDMGVIMLDLGMPGVGGRELLVRINERYPQIPVIIVTGANTVESAVGCMREGAFDYMVKPVEENRLVSGVSRAVEVRELRYECQAFRQRVFHGELDHPEAFSRILTANPTMYSVFQYAETVAGTGRPVLITGETGVGKELMAKALHELVPGKGNFVAVNVAGLDDSMFSDTLFGHVKGAFTGAQSVRPGIIEEAARGTLFLDEIGDLEQSSQVKLLRLMQEREYLPLGADAPKKSNARILLATNRDLRVLQERGTFRTDLYFRLQTHHIHIPPLRKRLDDLPLLLDAFLGKAADDLGRKKPTPPRQLVDLLSTYHFPGNIRELESMVFEAVSHHKSHTLSMDSFKNHMSDYGHMIPDMDRAGEAPGGIFSDVDKLPTLKEAHDLLIEEAIQRAKGNQSVAAGLLGISASGLSKALRRARKADGEG